MHARCRLHRAQVKRDAADGKEDNPRKVLATCDDQGKQTGRDRRIPNDLQNAGRGELPMAQLKQHGCEAAPGHAGDVPRKTQGTLGKARVTEQFGQVPNTKQPNKYVFLTEDRVRHSDRGEEDSGQVKHSGVVWA